MNLYDLLTNYDLSAAERRFDEFYMYNAITVEPFMCFNTTLYLTANLTASVSISKHNTSVQFFDMWSNDVVQVIFECGTENTVSLFNANRLLDDDCLRLFDSIDDIPDEELTDNNITRENLSVLKTLHDEIIEMLKKDETLKKSVL